MEDFFAFIIGVVSHKMEVDTMIVDIRYDKTIKTIGTQEYCECHRQICAIIKNDKWDINWTPC